MLTNNNAQPQSKVLLNFECKGLADLDVGSKSDPQVFVFQKAADGGQTLIGKTGFESNIVRLLTIVSFSFSFSEYNKCREKEERLESKVHDDY